MVNGEAGEEGSDERLLNPSRQIPPSVGSGRRVSSDLPTQYLVSRASPAPLMRIPSSITLDPPPSSIYSDSMKTSSFEAGPCDLAGASFEAGATTEQPFSTGAHGNSQTASHVTLTIWVGSQISYAGPQASTVGCTQKLKARHHRRDRKFGSKRQSYCYIIMG
jgi:hypothetical protein